MHTEDPGIECSLEPLSTYVVAADQSESTGLGLVLPDTVRKPSIATVRRVGPDVHVLSVDDVIVYKDGAAVELSVGNQRYLLIREIDVLARVHA